MGFESTNLQLQLNDFYKHESEQAVFKIFLNSVLGKFSQRDNYAQTAYVKSTSDIEKILQADNSIEDINQINESVGEIQFKSNKKKFPNRRNNVVIGAFITSLARIDMHKHIIHLNSEGFTILYTDVDSLVFVGNCNQSVPLKLGKSFGVFKKELGSHSEVSNVYLLGKKNYCILYSDKQTKSTLIKVRGMTLTSSVAESILTKEKFIEMYENFQKGNALTLEIPQIRYLTDNKKRIVVSKIANFKYSNDVKIERLIDKSTVHCETFPYGWYHQ